MGLMLLLVPLALAEEATLQPRHTAAGFANNYPHDTAYTSRLNFLKMIWQLRANGGEPEAKKHLPPTVVTDAEALKGPLGAPTLTWLGHATVLVQSGGVNLLTDPHLTERAGPRWLGPKRLVPPALTVAQLPHIHLVVISHNHYDHLDLDTLRALDMQPGGAPLVLVPLGVKKWLKNKGFHRVEELGWWQQITRHSTTLTFTPAQHFSARTPWDRNRTLWGSWAIRLPDLNFFFAGDTGLSPDFAEIGERLGPFDLAALPIGAYEPRWFMKPLHVNPAEAVQIHQDINARKSVAIHWGTFRLTPEPFDQPPRYLIKARAAAGLSADEFAVLAVGETRTYPPAASTGHKP